MPVIPQEPASSARAPSEVRKKYFKSIHDDEAELAELGKKYLGSSCHMVVGTELEFVVEMLDAKADFPLTHAVREGLFSQSPYVKKFVREPILKGHTDTTKEGNIGKQLEFVVRHKTAKRKYPARTFTNDEWDEFASAVKSRREEWESTHHGQSWKVHPEIRQRIIAEESLKLAKTKEIALLNAKRHRVGPFEAARSLEILPQLAVRKAEDYKLKPNFSSVPFISRNDQTSGLQANISLVDNKGKNLFRKKGGHASALMMCFILELIESDKDALAMFAPTPDAYNRYKQFAAPQYVGLGYRRGRGIIGGMLIRGKEYETRREPGNDDPIFDPDVEQKPKDQGSTRLEHRLPCPEIVMIEPDKFPYILMRYYLAHLKRAIKRYDRMRADGTLDTLNEEIALKTIEQRDIARKNEQPFTVSDDIPLAKSFNFPPSWNDAVRRFKSSERLQEIMGEDYKEVLEILNKQTNLSKTISSSR